MAAKSVRVRMYRTGLGDCFLLTFPGKANQPFHMLVDCGVFRGTPNERQIMRDVATSIRDATNGTPDALVATHKTPFESSAMSVTRTCNQCSNAPRPSNKSRPFVVPTHKRSLLSTKSFVTVLSMN